MSRLYSFSGSPEELRSLFRHDHQPSVQPRGHIGPGSSIGIVRMVGEKRVFSFVQWGFILSWATGARAAKRLANARSETILAKPTFRSAMRNRRCLIPADGFFQWRGGVPGKKQPFHIHRPDHALFAVAGLWETSIGEDGGEIETALTITTRANASLSAIHDRMPAVILPEAFDRWLDTDRFGAGEAAPLLLPVSDDYFVAEPVSLARRASEDKPAKPQDQLKLF